MHLKIFLNRVYRQPGFVFTDVRLSPAEEKVSSLWVMLRSRKESLSVCSGCNRKAQGNDTLAERRFEFVPLWGILVYFLYSMRRVDCPRCGVKVEVVPWAEGPLCQGGCSRSFRAPALVVAVRWPPPSRAWAPPPPLCWPRCQPDGGHQRQHPVTAPTRA